MNTAIIAAAATSWWWLLGQKILIAIAILVAGWMLAGSLSGLVRRWAVRNDKIDNTVGSFLAALLRYAILAAAVIVALNTAGVQATALTAVLGAVTLAIGFALQGVLANFAAGVMIMIFRPYRLGDFVEIAGVEGTVKDISIVATMLDTVDNVRIVAPNGDAWGGVIKNYSYNERRRVDLVFGIDYGDDIGQAIRIIESLIQGDDRIQAEPAPFVKLTNLGESSVDITVRVWTSQAHYWDVKFDLTRQVKEAFDRAGVTIPYPHSVEIQKPAA